jgi:hypothetical protein
MLSFETCLILACDDSTERRALYLSGSQRDKLLGFILAFANSVSTGGIELILDHVSLSGQEVK